MPAMNAEQALEYLMKNNVSEDMGRELVQSIGGRIVFLETCVVLIKKRG